MSYRRVLLLLPASVMLLGARSPAPTVSFRVAPCPSLYAPATCAGQAGPACQEAFTTGGPAAGCASGADHAVRLLPEDALPGDGGSSRSWSFRTRPGGRIFHSAYPETTGSVRVTTDGAGTPGSLAGATDEAHLRLSATRPTRRLLVLRWFTGGLPPGARGRVRLAHGEYLLFEGIEEAGPPAARTRVMLVEWRGDLDLTVSGSITGARDRPVVSADLLWHLAVLPPSGDADRDGIPNRRDPDPLDPATPRAIHRRARRPTVLVLGLDGAGWDVLAPLMDAGYLPAIRDVVAAGVRAPLDETTANAAPGSCCYCPPIWSTLMTGQPVAVHEMVDIPSEPWDRPPPSIAAVLSRHGGRATLVSYRNTFPAEPGTRYDFTEWGLDVAASELFRVNGLPLDPRSEYMNRLQLTWPPLLFETMHLLPAAAPGPLAWGPLARDRVSAAAVVGLAAREQTDLTMWILHSIDKTEHVTWTGVQPSLAAPLDRATLLGEAAAWTGPVVGGVWAFGDVASQNLEADRHLRELLSTVHYDYVMLLSDHAMTVNPTFPSPPLSGIHTLPPAFHGIFALRGPGVVIGRELAGVSALDVAPTLAYLLRLPVARSLPGRVLTEAFTPAHLAAHPVRRTPRW
jgi:hypothetical protein